MMYNYEAQPDATGAPVLGPGRGGSPFLFPRGTPSVGGSARSAGLEFASDFHQQLAQYVLTGAVDLAPIAIDRIVLRRDLDQPGLARPEQEHPEIRMLREPWPAASPTRYRSRRARHPRPRQGSPSVPP